LREEAKPDRDVIHEDALGMSAIPALSIITWAPFVGAVLIMFLARRNAALVRGLAVLSTSVSLVLSIAIYVAYDREAAGFQFYEDVPLVPALGINYQLGIDGMSLLMVLLTSIIIFAGAWASWTVKVRSQEFYALLLVLVTGVYGVFVSLDLFVVFLFYEIAVLPMYLLIGIWGSSGDVRPQGVFGWAFGRTGVGTKEYAAMKLTLYLLFGSAFILVGILALYVAGDSSSFSFLEMELTQFDPTLQSWVFLAFYVGFGILAGIWPLHTWSPDGHASAPTAVSMLHAGVLMKLGAYGVVRLGMGLLPDGTLEWSWLVGTIACVNIVYGALSAMAQTDLKYVIAYSSVSHMGVVMLGMATLTEVGLNGSVFQMFAHGIMTGLFFALVGLVYEKAHSREIFKMSGFGRMMPGIATAFTIAGLSSLGLPATAGFVAELLTFLGAWQSSHSWWLFPGVLGAYLTSIYVLRVTKQIFWGPPSPDPHFQGLPDARGPEWAALWILAATIVLFGVWPWLALAPVDTATMPLLNRLWVLQ
jgi:NADH-quinone oxidoreductase subunit M